ncbi:MAG: FHA domain-containing protein [Xenococcaceae cyanobacterium]
MITLTLLHKDAPVQNWTFGPESIIRIGRSINNEVVLYSAVVSRHHIELRRNGSDWELVNLGANGTYIQGKRIDKIRVVDGMIFNLASTGPKIQIRIDSEEESKMKIKDTPRKTPSSAEKTKKEDISKDTLFLE